MRARTTINQIVDRVRNGVSDMSYAQRLVFENRTGVATSGHDRRHGFSGHRRDPVTATSATDSRRSTLRTSRRDGAESLPMRHPGETD